MAQLLGIVRTVGLRGCAELNEVLNATMINDDPTITQIAKWSMVQRYLKDRYRMRVSGQFVTQWSKSSQNEAEYRNCS